MNQHLNHQITSHLKNLVFDRDESHFRKMKIALWLYLYLVLKINPKTGKAIFDPEKGEEETGISKDTLRSWLGHLRKGGYLSARKQGREILIKISGLDPEKSIPGNIPHISEREEIKDPKLLPNEVGKANALAHEIAEEFRNGKNLSFYQTLCEDYPMDIINRSFETVKKMPENKIRKSKGALFTYLVKKYANETSNQNPGH